MAFNSNIFFFLKFLINSLDTIYILFFKIGKYILFLNQNKINSS